MNHLYPPPTKIMYAVMSSCKIYGCYSSNEKAEDALYQLQCKVGFVPGLSLCKRKYFIKQAPIYD